MINLGPYSGKNCPNVRFQPTVLDRILEGTALLIVLVTWISIYWLYTQREGALLPAVWVMGGCSIFCFLLMGGLAYLPVRFINFPIRVTERNAAVQYLFAIRLTRVMNIILLLVLLGSVWGLYYAFGKLLLLVSFVLLGVAFIGYYILAFKYTYPPFSSLFVVINLPLPTNGYFFSSFRNF